MSDSRNCELDLEQAKKGDLPRVCIRCGEAAALFAHTRLDYHFKRVVLRLPLCSRHEDHWRWRGRAWAGILIGSLMLALSIAGVVATVSLDFRGVATLLLMMIVISAEIVAAVTFFGSAILYAVLSLSGIRIKRLGARTVTLTRVAPEFREAYRLHHAGHSVAGHPLSVPPEAVNPATPTGNVPLSDEAIAVMQTAQRDASLWGDDYIGTRHLLAGLRMRSSEAAHALEGLGLNFEQICDAHPKQAPAGAGRSAKGELPYTPALRRALACAADEARAARPSLDSRSSSAAQHTAGAGQ